MTTISCFLTIKYQLSNTLSHVCFEKMPTSWEFTHNWSPMTSTHAFWQMMNSWFTVHPTNAKVRVLLIPTRNGCIFMLFSRFLGIFSTPNFYKVLVSTLLGLLSIFLMLWLSAWADLFIVILFSPGWLYLVTSLWLRQT